MEALFAVGLGALGILTSFERDADVPVGSGVRRVQNHATHGRYALEIPLGKGVNFWPPKGIPPDWSGGDLLRLDVTNPGRLPATLRGLISDDPKKGYWERFNFTRVIPPGTSTIEFDVHNLIRGERGSARTVDPSRIWRVLFAARGKGGGALYVDNVRLAPSGRRGHARRVLDFAAGERPNDGHAAVALTVKHLAPGEKVGLRVTFEGRQTTGEWKCLRPNWRGMEQFRMHAWNGSEGRLRMVLLLRGALGDTSSANTCQLPFALEPGENRVSLTIAGLKCRDGASILKLGGMQQWVLRSEESSRFDLWLSRLIVATRDYEPETARSVGLRAAPKRSPLRRACVDALGEALRDAVDAMEAAGLFYLDETGAPAERFDPSPAERHRGYALFSCGPSRAILPGSRPPRPASFLRRATTATAVELVACRGERTAGTFVIVPVRDFRSVEVRLADLRGPGRIPASTVAAHAVRYSPRKRSPGVYGVQPVLLSSFDGLGLENGMSRQVWLTLHVPRGAEGGDYTGRADVLTDGRVSGSMRLKLRVLPYELPEAGDFGLFMGGPGEREAVRRMLEDLREHGMTLLHFFGPFRPRLRWEDGKARAEFGRADELASLAKELGFRLVSVSTHGPIIGLFKRKPPLSREKMRQEIKRFGKEILEHARANGWPEVILYVSDEPRESYQATDLARKTHFTHEETAFIGSALREVGARTIASVMSDAGGKGLKAVEPLSIISTHFWAKSRGLIAKAYSDPRKPLWFFNNGKKRYSFGLLNWAHRAVGHEQFTYLGRMSVEMRHGLVIIEDGEFRPTLRWELCSLGVNDYRYVRAVEELSKDSRSEAAEEARDHLARLRASLVKLGPLVFRTGAEAEAEEVVSTDLDEARAELARMLEALCAQNP